MRGRRIVKVEIEAEAFTCDGCDNAIPVPSGSYVQQYAPRDWLTVTYNAHIYTFDKPRCLERWARSLGRTQATDEYNARRAGVGMPAAADVPLAEYTELPSDDEANEA